MYVCTNHSYRTSGWSFKYLIAQPEPYAMTLFPSLRTRGLLTVIQWIWYSWPTRSLWTWSSKSCCMALKHVSSSSCMWKRFYNLMLTQTQQGLKLWVSHIRRLSCFSPLNIHAVALLLLPVVIPMLCTGLFCRPKYVLMILVTIWSDPSAPPPTSINMTSDTTWPLQPLFEYWILKTLYSGSRPYINVNYTIPQSLNTCSGFKTISSVGNIWHIASSSQ